MWSELASARKYLQSVIEQHDASNEELRCANEEVLSSNEELQSTNEQLATAKEELQSTNEELVTLNEEMHTRNVELTQLNQDLKKAHEQLLNYITAVVDTVRGPFLVLRADLHVQKANDAFLKAFRVSAKETENHLIYEVGGGQWNIPSLREALSEIQAGKPARKDFEAVHHFPKAGRLVMRLNARRLEQNPDEPPMILLSVEDITEFKQIEEVTRWLAAIVESSDDAIIIKDLEGKIISCNQGASRLFGYAPGELIGQPVTVLIPPELRGEEAKILERIGRGERIEHFETLRQRKDGSILDVSLTISPVKDAAGKVIGASKITHDITGIKQTQRQLAESLTREQAAREHAESANRSKDDFLAVLSHELRTPLNPVLLLASDAAKNRDLPLSARSDFEIIRKNVELEARLIDDLLDLTRITFGKLFLDLRMVDAYAILQDAISAAKPDLDAKQIKPTLDLNAEEHNVLADAVRLQQVFWNILKNAVKFTPEKGQITVESSVSGDGESLCVKVIDSGIGMTREELDRIFTAFSQGNHKAARRFGGLGLGLAISRKLIELHSGQISASSSGSGRGSTFTIELPLARPGCNGLLADELPAKEILANKSKPGSVHILLVEDHAPTRDALTRLLLRRNFKVASAASLAEARKLAAEKRFDLVISDIGLPDGSGNDLMTELNRDYGLKGAALTGCGMEQDVERSLASGFLTHLTKPVGIDSLEKALSLLMS